MPNTPDVELFIKLIIIRLLSEPLGEDMENMFKFLVKRAPRKETDKEIEDLLKQIGSGLRELKGGSLDGHTEQMLNILGIELDDENE